MNNDPFASVVSKCQTAAAVDLSGDWKPDPGQYTAVLSDVSDGIGQKSGKPFVRTSLQIIDGDLKGRTFTDLFSIDEAQKGQMGIRGLALAAACVAGAEIPQAGKNTGQFVIECRNTLRSHKGAVLVVEVKREANKQPGPNKPDYYTRINYARRIPTTATA